MALLADHPERWAAMGRASVERAQEHSLEKTIDRYEGYYREVLSKVPLGATPEEVGKREVGIGEKER